MTLQTYTDGRNFRGYQVFVSDSGKISTRYKSRDDQESGEGWTTFSNGGNNYWQIPQTSARINNTETLQAKQSGYYLTSYNCQGTPNDLRPEERSGILQTIVEDKETGNHGYKGLQIFYPMNGTEFLGVPYMRIYKGNNHGNGQTSTSTTFSEWLNPVSLIRLRYYNKQEIDEKLRALPQQQETFRHHKLRVDDIKLIVNSGYYHTTEHTQHLPEEVMQDTPSKNGILLIINKDQKIHYEYTPIAGKYKGHMYIGDFTQGVSRKGDPINWTRVAASEGHIKVHDTRSQPQLTPQQYHEHTNEHGGGYILYEWKWGSDIGLTQPQGNTNILLQTIIPEDKETVGDDFINQIAYDMLNMTWHYRKAQDRGGTHWTEWKTPTTGGGSQIIVKADLTKPLKDMFTNWRDTYLRK